ncbi:MAG: hypothetical protein F6K48_17570 [Okeania sp. SIO3H1]|uniref:hypothetical protein n=1 Tax=Okeania sp. SIO1I7 TaxID=2607772 RepID=UPI0013CD5A12|nr:hypothetical protein [Okeania sp. SIO1I7]NEN90618.1 hypothetical protein [Okeania sp. SIO3H1]NET25504.1 hypothetical protein [Okeania sp. SIO1I7]
MRFIRAYLGFALKSLLVEVGDNPPLAPHPSPSQEGRGSQESGGERITKMSVVMTIGDFFYAQ